MLLSSSRAHLLVVDVQERLLPTMSEPSRVLAQVQKLVVGARRLGIPVTVSEQYPKGIGHTVAPLREVLDDAGPILAKLSFSGLRDAAIAERVAKIRAQGRDQVIVCGIEAHVCVLQSAIDLVEAGCTAAIVADAVSSRIPASTEIALRRAVQAGVVVVNTEMVLFEWLEQAGSPQFKEILALIKPAA